MGLKGPLQQLPELLCPAASASATRPLTPFSPYPGNDTKDLESIPKKKAGSEKVTHKLRN